MGAQTSSGVMVFRVPGADMSAAYQALYSDLRVAGAGRGGEFDGIRLSPHIYNTLADVDYVIDAIAGVTA